MGWFSRSREFKGTDVANPWDETVINYAPYDSRKLVRGRVEQGTGARARIENGHVHIHVPHRNVRWPDRKGDDHD